MNKFISVTAVIFCLTLTSLFGQVKLSGRIVSEGGEPLPGATVYFPDVKVGSASNIDGEYVISNLPKGKFMIQVKLLGYQTHTESVDLSAVEMKNFVLRESVVEVKEVIVTGVSQATERNRTPTPVTIVPKSALLQVPSANIIEAVANQPGISQVSTGAGISKPVIRGLGYNRVLVVNDGIRQEGQQWGDEHGIEIDEYSVHQVEILKGPASLAYGSDALAGVMHFISTPTPENGSNEGELITNYQTNNGLAGFSLNMNGNKNGLIYSIRFSGKEAHSYKNRNDGYVFNSGFSEMAVGGIIGINRSWGFSHLHFSGYSIKPGIVEGNRDSLTGQFTKELSINNSVSDVIATTDELRSYERFVPFQEVIHYKAVSVNSFMLGKGRLSLTAGYQLNDRKEFADALLPKDYNMFFHLNTINYDVRYILPERMGFQSSVGLNGMSQTSRNLGKEFLVPEYELFDIGSFAIVKKSYQKLDISGGLRYDIRFQSVLDLYLDSNDMRIKTPDINSKHQFVASTNRYEGVSGSLGISYQLSETMYAKLNFSRGFRSPNIAEIGANGIHEGSIRYEIGDPSLKPEKSFQSDFAYVFHTGHVTAEVDLFNNKINDFIFPVKLNSIYGGDSITDGFPTFKYVSGNAVLSGGELLLDVHPHPFDWLHIQNSYSYVASYQPGKPDTLKYLPYNPPGRYQAEVIINKKKLGKYIMNPYLQAGIQCYFSQENFYAAYGTETRTPSYTLLNASVGADFKSWSRADFTLIGSVSNIMDVAYQSHLSRLKYAPVNYSTGRTGVYNMGRNISIKLIVHFN